MISGSCLCEKVRVEVSGAFEHPPDACHCRMCRKQTGHFYAGINIRKTSLKVQGEEHVKWFQSSEEVKRGFCAHCGSTLFWQPLKSGYEWVSVSMGVFDQDTGQTLAKHIFVADKGGYYQIADGLPQYEGF